MNRWASLILVVGLCSFPVSATAEVRLPTGSAGEVTLDWQKFNDLWTQMQKMEKQIEDLQKPEHLPPVPFTITKAAYKGVMKTNQLSMTAVFELMVYEPKEWVKIPFLPSSLAITDASLNGEPVGLLQEGGYHTLVLKKPGRHVLRVAFPLKAPRSEEAPQMQFNIQPTPMTILALEFPQPQLDVTVEPSQGLEIQSLENNRTLVTAAIPPTSSIQLRWQKAVPEENAGPAKLYLDNQQLVTVSEGTLKSHWSLNYSVLRRGVRELRLGVPESWNILSVYGEGLQEWKVVEGSKGPELLVQFAYARRGSFSIGVTAEKGLGEKVDVIEIPTLKALNIEREQGAIGIEAKGAVELQVQDSKGLQVMDPQELPGGIWQNAGQPILFAFRYTKPYNLALSVTRHPEVAVLTTTIDEANGITVLTSRGQMITKIRYQVRNQLKQYLSVRLPKDAELWSSFVAGQPVKPTQAQDGSYRIPLAKSQLGAQGQEGFPVEVIYYRPVAKFIPIGRRQMSLPMPDAPVSRMFWSLYLPEKYRIAHFGGDVEKGEMAQPWNALAGAARVDRSVISGSAGEGEEAGSKSNFKSDFRGLARKMLASKSAAVDQAVARQSEVSSGLFEEKNAPKLAGVFPVAFELPASGQLFNFGQVMIVGQDPTISMIYLHAGIIRALGWLLIGGLLFAIYRHRSSLMKVFQLNIARIRALIPA